MKNRLLCALACLCALLTASAAPLAAPARAAEAAPVIVRSPQTLRVDGAAAEACEKYNIDGSNYFMLRDLAALLTDTAARFAVDYDPERNAAVITTGLPYTPDGSELAVGPDRSAEGVPSPQTVVIDGVERRDLSAWNFGGHNFFQLRQLGAALGFAVDYDPDANAALVFSGGAAEDFGTAYLALRQWVRRSYNTLTVAEGDPVYWRETPFGTGPWQRSGVRWCAADGALQLLHHARTDAGGEYYVTLTLAPGGQVHRAALQFYSSGSVNIQPFYGLADIDAAALRADSVPVFDTILGWPEDTPEQTRMGKLLRDGLLRLLALADDLLRTQAAPGLGCSAADFGFDPALAAADPGSLAMPLRLYTDDGKTFLGVVGFGDDRSIWNTGGYYGNRENADCVLNKEGPYGSETGDESINNPYATRPPVLRDANGGFVCRVSVNDAMPGTYSLQEILIYLIEAGYYTP